MNADNLKAVCINADDWRMMFQKINNIYKIYINLKCVSKYSFKINTIHFILCYLSAWVVFTAQWLDVLVVG